MPDTKPPHIVSQIIGRCHVGQSNRAVLRYFVSRLRHGYQTWTQLPKSERKQWMQWVFQTHAENRELYRAVMTGRF